MPVRGEGGETSGLIFDIRRYSVQDGPGIRTTVFFKGCPLACWWCHNPESQGRAELVHYDPGRCLRCGACVDACEAGALALGDAGVILDPDRCTLTGGCVATCPAEARQRVGRRYDVAEVVAAVERDQLFHDESGGGVTVSGGEPLLQWEFLLELLTACGERGIHRAVDTSGLAAPDVLLRVAARTDLFLYDLKTLDPARHEATTGVPLRPVLDNLSRLLESGARVWVRLPLIGGINDSPADVERLGGFLAGLDGGSRLEAVHLLPFHGPARSKHARFGMPWRLGPDGPVSDARVREVVARLEEHGLAVSLGGGGA